MILVGKMLRSKILSQQNIFLTILSAYSIFLVSSIGPIQAISQEFQINQNDPKYAHNIGDFNNQSFELSDGSNNEVMSNVFESDEPITGFELDNLKSASNEEPTLNSFDEVNQSNQFQKDIELSETRENFAIPMLNNPDDIFAADLEFDNPYLNNPPDSPNNTEPESPLPNFSPQVNPAPDPEIRPNLLPIPTYRNSPQPIVRHETSTPLSQKTISELTSYARVANLPYCNKLISFGKYVKGVISLPENTAEITLSFSGGFSTKTIDSDELVNYSPALGSTVPYVKVHKGYFNAFVEARASVLHLIRTEIKKRKGRSLVITLVGHSTGGVYAVLAALFLRLNIRNKINLYTFGQPRIGNNEFAQYINSRLRSHRVVNANDAIAVLPPANQGYLHSQTEYWIKPNNGGAIKCSVSSDEPQESTQCRLSQGEGEIQSNYGPYFGVLMGSC
ncbi:hypothetical protein G9A89_005649 [Geosiphon pyriformis]|nr:hypothetical protein G9A89_005649 [Geosiphon pyriformis]